MEKEQYLKVKAAWARSVNNKDYKPCKDENYGNKIQGKLFNIHYLVYNLIRGYDGHRGMTNISKDVDELMQMRMDWYIIDKPLWRMEGARISKLLFPFEDTITEQELRNILK